jgi:putative iron-regulated protein
MSFIPTRLSLPNLTPALAAFLCAFAGFGCAGEEDDAGVPRAEVVESYAALVSANYADALAGAKDLDAAIVAFTESPSDETLEAAKSAWLASRTPYGLSEAYRFYQGPIDNDDGDDDIADGPEGLINSWPLDESYIDYVVDAKGAPINGGIINMPEEFPSLDAETLAAQNAKVTETTISTGYHAIEFLLWGQDLNEDGPGQRPYTDFVTGPDGTAENQARRAEYLKSVSSLLVDDLSLVNEAWLDGEANYRADFVAGSSEAAIQKMLLGIGSLSGAELSGERMRVAYDNKDQEDEHSCFSDNTLADLHNNATSIQNVLLGRYGDLDGPGIDALVEAKDPALAKKLREQIQEAIDNIDAVPAPFDQAILGDDDSDARQHLLTAIQALQHFTETLVDAAEALNIDLKFDE